MDAKLWSPQPSTGKPQWQWYGMQRSNLSLQEAQLPQRNSASAAHINGGGSWPSSPLPLRPSDYTCAYGRIRKPQRSYAKRAIRKAHFKMNRAFKVILIGAGRNPEWSFVVMCN